MFEFDFDSRGDCPVSHGPRPVNIRQYHRVMPGTTGFNDGFGDVLFYVSWWDCPRSGVALFEGEPMHFDCRFDRVLADYPAMFALWYATEVEVAAGAAFFHGFATWRGQFDAGRATPAFGPVAYQSPEPPASAQWAIPEWRLDRDRSFVDRIPRHRVRWRFMGLTKN